MHMRHEHLKDGWWELPGASSEGWPGTKNGRTHRVWLSAPVVEIIGNEMDEASDYVFAGPRGAPVRLDRAMKEACEASGIQEKITPHDLRRTFGSTVTRLGFGRQAMDRLLNHTDRTVGSIYDRYSYADEDRQIMEAVAKFFMGLKH